MGLLKSAFSTSVLTLDIRWENHCSSFPKIEFAPLLLTICTSVFGSNSFSGLAISAGYSPLHNTVSECFS